MEGYFFQIAKIIKEERPEVFLIPGDIFDKWKPSPALINFTIFQLNKLKLMGLSRILAIPGQHDLRYHNLQDIEQTGYWTLVQAGSIEHLTPGQPVDIKSPNGSVSARVYGYPWGTSPDAKDTSRNPNHHALQIAIVHRYCWLKGHAFPGAPEEQHAKQTSIEYTKFGFDLAFFGDNHSEFVYTQDNACEIINCGSFMNRTKEQMQRNPKVYVVRENGVMDTFRIKTDKDEWWMTENPTAKNDNSYTSVIQALQSLSGASVDGRGTNFLEQVRRASTDPTLSKYTKDFILHLIEEYDGKISKG
jgi:DNA repair exonuclease SbcCD nuclease subunit